MEELPFLKWRDTQKLISFFALKLIFMSEVSVLVLLFPLMFALFFTRGELVPCICYCLPGSFSLHWSLFYHLRSVSTGTTLRTITIGTSVGEKA